MFYLSHEILEIFVLVIISTPTVELSKILPLNKILILIGNVFIKLTQCGECFYSVFIYIFYSSFALHIQCNCKYKLKIQLPVVPG